jgi:hypothetical protein
MHLTTFNSSHHRIIKRSWLDLNLGGTKTVHNPVVNGNDNNVVFDGQTQREAKATLLQKAGNQLGRVLESGTDIIIAPAKWLSHMQENWYVSQCQI